MYILTELLNLEVLIAILLKSVIAVAVVLPPALSLNPHSHLNLDFLCSLDCNQLPMFYLYISFIHEVVKYW